MASATFQELRTAFPRAHSDFIVACQDKGLTVEKARAEYDEETAKALEEKEQSLAKAKAEIDELKKEAESKAKAKAEEEEKKEAEAKAKAEEEEKAAEAKAKAGVKAAAGGRVTGGQSARAVWDDAIAEKIKSGLPRAKAFRAVAIENPDLQLQVIAEANP